MIKAVHYDEVEEEWHEFSDINDSMLITCLKCKKAFIRREGGVLFDDWNPRLASEKQGYWIMDAPPVPVQTYFPSTDDECPCFQCRWRRAHT